jgi:hypothetical protein
MGRKKNFLLSPSPGRGRRRGEEEEGEWREKGVGRRENGAVRREEGGGGGKEGGKDREGRTFAWFRTGELKTSKKVVK